MMKRTIALLLTLALIPACLAGCESEPENLTKITTGIKDSENPAITNTDTDKSDNNPPTYAEILALHKQDPDRYRDPGELQPETQEMIQLEDGQWYQSFVYDSYNCRCVFLSSEEAEMQAAWDFVPIGSAENAFLYNIGVLYDDPSSAAQYAERSIAVRGTLAQGPEGYAYQLLLPDELIVCLPGSSGGTCVITEAGTLAIPESDASLFENLQGEVVVTGVVMRDENSVFYLKNIALFNGASL